MDRASLTSVWVAVFGSIFINNNSIVLYLAKCVCAEKIIGSPSCNGQIIAVAENYFELSHIFFATHQASAINKIATSNLVGSRT